MTLSNSADIVYISKILFNCEIREPVNGSVNFCSPGIHEYRNAIHRAVIDNSIYFSYFGINIQSVDGVITGILYKGNRILINGYDLVADTPVYYCKFIHSI